MEFKRVIDVTKTERQYLAKTFGVSEKTVYNALTFDKSKGYTDTAKRIRHFAMQRGGILMNLSPEVETIHDSDGYMRQYFPKDVMLEIQKSGSGTVTLCKKGEVVYKYDNPTITELESIQRIALSL